MRTTSKILQPAGLILSILFLLCSGLIAKKRMSSLDKLVEEKVIPDVIDVKPKAEIKVDWSNGVTAQQESSSLYTLAMVDPDAPSRAQPSLREILHFMIANIPGNDVSKGDTFAEYVGSGAPEKTGLHRYIFLLFKQKEKLPSDLMKIKKTSRVGRTKFSIREFAKKHNLGDPVAANFFQAQYDDYVPKLHAQLSQA